MGKYSNAYFERYAKLCLTMVINPSFAEFVRIDEAYPSNNYTFPDLIPPEGSNSNIGVEVTRALTPERGQEITWIAQNFGENKTAEQINLDREKRFHSVKSKCTTIDGCTVGPGYSYNSDLSAKIITEKIERKLEKLNSTVSTKKLYKSNRLFVFAHVSLSSIAIEKVLEKTKHNKFDLYFDIIYIMGNDTLYVLTNGNEKTFKTIPIDSEILEDIKSEANPLL